MKKLIVSTIMVIASFQVSAAQVSDEVWQQTSSTVGDCSNCTVTTHSITPHIIEITSNNDWVGYAYYNQENDVYRGAMEWKAGEGGTYENQVFLIELSYQENTLTMNAHHGEKLEFSATYRTK